MPRQWNRRIGPGPPQLVGHLRLSGLSDLEAGTARAIERAWDDAMEELQNFLKYLQEAADDGLPAGGYGEIPETITAGHDGEPGEPTFGWSPGPHDHPVETAAPPTIGTDNEEGTGTALARAGHIHQKLPREFLLMGG
jgi:hypothetical protein